MIPIADKRKSTRKISPYTSNILSHPTIQEKEEKPREDVA
jgi:hypothetical protein